MDSCPLRGPYLPLGDTDWTCMVHGVEAELRDPSRPSNRRDDYRCPIENEKDNDR